MTLTKTLLSLSFCATTLLFSSCEIADNAKKATKNSGAAAKAAGDSREEIAQSRLLGRSGGSSASRREAIKSLMEMNTFPMKVTEASKYVKAFEFQLWTGQKYETQAYKDRLYEDAMSELFRSIEELYGKPIAGQKLSPFKALPKAKNRNLNIYALAVAMHGTHQYQEVETRNKKNIEKESIYDVLKRSLTKVIEVENGEKAYSSLKRYEEVVYNYKNEAIELINARYNMLLTMNMSKVSELKKNTLVGLNLLYFKKSFKSKFQQLNIGEQEETNKYLDAANKVKKFMNSIGEVLKVHPKISKLYTIMQIDDVEDSEIQANSILTLDMKTKSENLSEHKRLMGELTL